MLCQFQYILKIKLNNTPKTAVRDSFILMYKVLGKRIDIKGLLACNKCFLYSNKVGTAAPSRCGLIAFVHSAIAA